LAALETAQAAAKMSISLSTDLRRKSDPPGPRMKFPIPLLWQFTRDPLAAIANLAERYGDVAQVRVGARRYILLSHPDHIEQVLTNRNMLRSAPLIMRDLLGNGLLTSQGELHRQQRRLMNPSFPRHRIEALGEAVTSCTDRVVRHWMDGATIDVSQEMLRLTLAIIVHVILGPGGGPSIGALLDVFAMFVRMTERNRTPYLDRLLASLPLRTNSRLQDAAKQLREVLHTIIVERRSGDLSGADVLTFLLETQRCPDRTVELSDRQIEDEILALLLAGHETTSNTLTWMWYLLSQNPEVEARWHAELESVLSGRTPVAGDLPQLAYTRMVFLETLRLYPPVWILSRRPRSDFEIGGYHVPAWSSLNICSFLTHRDPRYFFNPERFQPERFAVESHTKRPRFSFFPFGGGERQCLGQGFAMMEGPLIAAAIGQRWGLRLVKGHRVETEPLITIRPKYGMKMTLQTRSRRVSP
jgi:cytochrome P450